MCRHFSVTPVPLLLPLFVKAGSGPGDLVAYRYQCTIANFVNKGLEVTFAAFINGFRQAGVVNVFLSMVMVNGYSSFTIMRKRSGPRIVPWGTLPFPGVQSDTLIPSFIRCFLSMGKSMIQFTKDLLMSSKSIF